MIMYKILFITSLFFISWSTQANSSMNNVIFIGTNSYVPSNADYAAKAGLSLSAFNLDAHRNLESQLTKGLPNNKNQAELIVKKRFSKLSIQEIQLIFKGTALAIKYDVKKVPAFIFNNGTEVIYGITNTEEAIIRWKAKRR